MKNLEQMILLMLADLYRPPEERKIDPEFISDAVRGGHLWALESRFTCDPHKSDDAYAVKDVLQMWMHLKYSYRKLPSSEQETVLAALSPHLEDVTFPGFDANEEDTYLELAEFLVEKMGWDKHYKDGIPHHASFLWNMNTYRRMQREYASLDGVPGADATARQIVRVINAAQ